MVTKYTLLFVHWYILYVVHCRRPACLLSTWSVLSWHLGLVQCIPGCTLSYPTACVHTAHHFGYVIYVPYYALSVPSLSLPVSFMSCYSYEEFFILNDRILFLYKYLSCVGKVCVCFKVYHICYSILEFLIQSWL